MSNFTHTDRGSFVEVETTSDEVQAIFDACMWAGADQDEITHAAIAQSLEEERVSAGLQAEAGVFGATTTLVLMQHSEPTRTGSIGWVLAVAHGRVSWVVSATGPGYRNSISLTTATVSQRDHLMDMLRLAAG